MYEEKNLLDKINNNDCFKKTLTTMIVLKKVFWLLCIKIGRKAKRFFFHFK